MQIDLGNTRGIKKYLDDKGRIVIPKEFIRSLDIEDKLEIFLLEDGLYMRKG